MIIVADDDDDDIVDDDIVQLLNNCLMHLDFQSVQDRSDALSSRSSFRGRDVQQWSGSF